MRLFLSYTRQDQPKVDQLVHGLRLLHHEIWLDQELSGGQAWWDAILGRIRDSDALFLALSPAALDSEACKEEYRYALALGKPVLPIMVEKVLPEVLPSELAVIQVVDYTASGQEAVFRLAGALSALPSAPPLPDHLPAPPPVPVSYLSDLSRRIHAPALTLDEQLALAARLKTALQRTKERDAAEYLLRQLQQRDDLYFATAKELSQLEFTASSHSATSPQNVDSSRTEKAESARTWKLERVEREDFRRALIVSRNEVHTIEYIIAKSEQKLLSLSVTIPEILKLNGQVVTRHNHMSQRTNWPFTILDGGENISAKLTARGSAWNSKINTCRLEIGGDLLYDE